MSTVTELSQEQIDRHLIAATVLPTGNPWLDDVFSGGLCKSNLLLAAARTGVGKTFFGVQLAHFAAKAGKTVLYFALEAEKFEIERRQLYYAVCGLLHEHYPTIPIPRYREWLLRGYDNQWHALENQARKKLDSECATLQTEYRPQVYTPEAFKQDVYELVASVPDSRKPDLVILDHLHHFFLNGDEIDALKLCIHSIKRLQSEFEVPIVVLAQLRKGESSSKQQKRTLPFLEDIRGTAALTDVATDVLIISPVPEDKESELPSDAFMPMYFWLPKSRTCPEARKYAAISCFSPKKGRYEPKYFLSEVHTWEDPTIVDPDKIPLWAKNVQRLKTTSQTQMKNTRDAKERRFKDD